MTEHVLVWHPKVSGDTPAAAIGDDQVRLIGMPTGLVRPVRQALATDQLTPAAREIMDAIVADLQRRAAGMDGPPTRYSLRSLDEAGKAAIADILGEGDVWAKVGVGDRFWRVVESVMTGVWRLESTAADGTVEECIDVGPVPGPILRGKVGDIFTITLVNEGKLEFWSSGSTTLYGMAGAGKQHATEEGD